MFLKNNSLFFRDKRVLALVGLSLLLNICLWAVLGYKIHPSSVVVPLHYNIYFGIDLLGQWYEFFLIPLFGSFIFMINTILAFFLVDKEKVLSFAVLSACAGGQVFLLFYGIYILIFLVA